MRSNTLPVRDDAKKVTYHRNPTPSEIRFGNGATHYRYFTVSECCKPGTQTLKRWFVANDGLRYFR